MAGAVQIPVIQTGDKNIVQLQQNTNKVFSSLSSDISNLQDSMLKETIVGEIKLAALTVTEFQSVAGSNWLLCNGQSCVNTSYSGLTGQNTVPTIVAPFGVAYVNAFIRVS